MTIHHLTLLNEIRERLDDVGGDAGNPLTGFVYRWQNDDTGCLWKNIELVNYLNEAIYDVGLRKPIYDTDDAAICAITVVSGTRVYALDPLILSIEEARLASTGLPLIKTTVKRMRELIGRYRPTENWRVLPGAVTHYLEDEHTRQLTLYHTPSANDSIKLCVKRLFKDSVSWTPLATEATLTTAFTDIPDYYRRALVLGVIALAYRKRDSDTLNMDYAKEAEQMLDLEVGPRISFAEHESKRLSSNLWRSKSINEVIQPQQRRAKTENDERATERTSE